MNFLASYLSGNLLSLSAAYARPPATLPPNTPKTHLSDEKAERKWKEERKEIEQWKRTTISSDR
jgi:hypothetical protein